MELIENWIGERIEYEDSKGYTHKGKLLGASIRGILVDKKYILADFVRWIRLVEVEEE